MDPGRTPRPARVGWAIVGCRRKDRCQLPLLCFRQDPEVLRPLLPTPLLKLPSLNPPRTPSFAICLSKTDPRRGLDPEATSSPSEEGSHPESPELWVWPKAFCCHTSW